MKFFIMIYQSKICFQSNEIGSLKVNWIRKSCIKSDSIWFDENKMKFHTSVSNYSLPECIFENKLKKLQLSCAQLSERFACLGIMGAQVRALLKPLQHPSNTISRGSRGGHNCLRTKKCVFSQYRLCIQFSVYSGPKSNCVWFPNIFLIFFRWWIHFWLFKDSTNVSLLLSSQSINNQKWVPWYTTILYTIYLPFLYKKPNCMLCVIVLFRCAYCILYGEIVEISIGYCI